MKNLSLLIVLSFLTPILSCGEQDKINGITQLDQQNLISPCYVYSNSQKISAGTPYLARLSSCPVSGSTTPEIPIPPQPPVLTQPVSVPPIIKIAYSDVADETKYVFYRCAGEGCGTNTGNMVKLQIEPGSCSSGEPRPYEDKAPNAPIYGGTYYEYRAKACIGDYNCSIFSDRVGVLANIVTGIDDVTPPDLWSPINNSNLPGSSITFEWGPSYAGACADAHIYFQAYVKKEPSGTLVPACWYVTSSGYPGSCSYTINTGSGSYSWFVRAFDWCSPVHSTDSVTWHFTH